MCASMLSPADRERKGISQRSVILATAIIVRPCRRRPEKMVPPPAGPESACVLFTLNRSVFLLVFFMYRYVCVLFALNLSTQHPAQPVSALINPREIQSLWSQNYDTCRYQFNAMPLSYQVDGSSTMPVPLCWVMTGTTYIRHV